MAVGIVVLAGWSLGQPALTSLGYDITVKANTAVCFVLLGAALWRRATRPVPDPLSTLLAGLAAAVGGLTVLEHVTGMDPGIDQLLFTEPPGAAATAAPGRMGPPASVSFLMLGTALALVGRQRRALRGLAQALTFATAFIALLSLVGYAYGASELYGIARFTGIALPTAVVLEGLAIGVALVTPRGGLVEALRGSGVAARIARRTALYTVLVPLVVGWMVAFGLRANLYRPDFALAALVLVLVLVMTLLAWRDATHIARVEEQRERAAQGLHDNEAQLRTRAAELNAVISSIPDGVLVVDARGRLVRANAAAVEILGLAEAELQASLEERMARIGLVRETGEPLPLTATATARALRGETVVGAVQGVPRAGGTRWISTSAAPIHEPSGALAGAVVTFADVTERKRMEEDLREADRRKDEFLAILSHELRNPLAPIRNAVFLLQRGRANAPGHALEIIERQVGHLSRMVEDLLDVSRISRGKVQLQASGVDLAELVRRTVDDHRVAATRAGLALGLSLPAGAIRMQGDPTRLAQVLGNLLSNAMKFTPEGGRVDVSLAREGGTGVLRVRDTGTGLDAAMQARLFEPFAQADRTLDRSRGGLGLGLTLVKAFVELHGGTVEAQSAGAGQGTEFVVRLPVAPEAPSPETHAGSHATGAPLRILVIEDNVDAADTLREALEMFGHRVQVAHDGEEGLVQARSARPDVALCDIGLPGKSGYDVARAIRDDPELRDMVLIAVTGYASPDDRRNASQAGFHHHFAKPAPLPELLAILAEVSSTPASP
jgi:PAS domain S-box-containing protein